MVYVEEGLLSIALPVMIYDCFQIYILRNDNRFDYILNMLRTCAGSFKLSYGIIHK